LYTGDFEYQTQDAELTSDVACKSDGFTNRDDKLSMRNWIWQVHNTATDTIQCLYLTC